MVQTNLIEYIKHTPENFNSAIFSGLLNGYINNIKDFYEKSNLEKIDDYLYKISYDKIDTAAGDEYFKQFKTKLGGCTSVRKNSYYGRNYDWYYDDTVTFVVSANLSSSHSFIGVTGSINMLDEDFVVQATWNDIYAVLPNIILDGINDSKLICSMNVVPQDYGITTGTNPGKKEVCGMGMCSYLLQNAATADEAVGLMKKVNIWIPKIFGTNYELHFMIADPNKTYVVEIINNKLQIKEFNYMTNFYLHNVEFNEDGKVYTPYTMDSDHDAFKTNHITKFGSGLERFNMIVDEYDDIEDSGDLTDLMKSLNYTNAYSENPDASSWYTEFVGARGVTVDIPAADYAEIMEIAYSMYENRTRSSHDTWQTVHTSIYNIDEKTLEIYCQEGSDKYTFSLE